MRNLKVGLVLVIALPLLLLLLVWSGDNHEAMTNGQDRKRAPSGHLKPELLPASQRQQHHEDLQQDTKAAVDDVLSFHQILTAVTPTGEKTKGKRITAANYILSGKFGTRGKVFQDSATRSIISLGMFYLNSFNTITRPLKGRDVGVGGVRADQHTRVSRETREDLIRKNLVTKIHPTDEVATTTTTYTSQDSQHHSQTNSRTSAVILCDHPLHTFSPLFTGEPEKTCIRGTPMKITQLFLDSSQISVEKMCKSALNIVDDESVGYFADFSNKTYIVYTGRFATFCSPVFAKFLNCTEDIFLTVCHDVNVILINHETCPSANSEYDVKYIVETYVSSKTIDCIADICKGSYEVTQNTEKEIFLFFIRYSPNCLYIKLPDRVVSDSIYYTENLIWPSCYPYQIMVWSDNPRKHGLDNPAAYLPSSCFNIEVSFVVMVGCVALSGVVGNLLVIVVMRRTGKHGGGESSRIRTSLAIADLIIAVFVVCPAFYYHIINFLSTPVYSVKTPQKANVIIPQKGFIKYSGFPLCQAMIYNVCATVSIHTVFLLSIERLILTARPLKYKHYITAPVVNGLISLSWVMAVLQNFLFVYRGGENLIQAFWDSFSKLPHGYTSTDAMFKEIIGNIHYIFLAIICLVTVLFSVLAIICFLRGQARLKAEWEALSMKYAGPMKKENRHIIITQLIIILFLLLSFIPYGCVMIIWNIKVVVKYPFLCRYIGQWCFIASTAWNPWIYNFRSKPFKEDLTLTWQRFSQHIHSFSK